MWKSWGCVCRQVTATVSGCRLVCVCVCVCVVQGWWLCGVVLWRIFFLHYRDIMCEFVSLCPLQSLIDC